MGKEGPGAAAVLLLEDSRAPKRSVCACRSQPTPHTHTPSAPAGQTYFWNESTGETTELGEPRPTSRFRDSGFRGAGDDARFQDGWREPPDRDRTYTYSAIGALNGVAAGWATQYFH